MLSSNIDWGMCCAESLKLHRFHVAYELIRVPMFHPRGNIMAYPFG